MMDSEVAEIWTVKAGPIRVSTIPKILEVNVTNSARTSSSTSPVLGRACCDALSTPTAKRFRH
jgi:hypothetical protein